MWFKKKKNDEAVKNNAPKDDSMSKMIDEVLNEKAAEKEAAMRESAEGTVGAGEAAQNGAVPQTLFVPMIPVEGSENKETKTMQFHPAVVKNSEGELMFPAFSEKTQIPEDYGKQYTTVSVPFAAACEMAAKIPECKGIVINPFTKPMIVNKDAVQNVANAVAEQRKNGQATVEFSTPEPEVKAIAGKIAGWFKKQPEIKGAYFTKMKQQGRVSYAFIIDCNDDVHKAVCERTVEFLKAEKVALPIALLKYKGLEKVVNESRHIEKVC